MPVVDPCPWCGYDLRTTPYVDGVATCSECGHRIPAHVPRMGWPLRCPCCRRDLTGEPIVRGRIRCPACPRVVPWHDHMRPRNIQSPTELLLPIGGAALLVLAASIAGIVLILAAAILRSGGP